MNRRSLSLTSLLIPLLISASSGHAQQSTEPCSPPTTVTMRLLCVRGAASFTEERTLTVDPWRAGDSRIEGYIPLPQPAAPNDYYRVSVQAGALCDSVRLYQVDFGRISGTPRYGLNIGCGASGGRKNCNIKYGSNMEIGLSLDDDIFECSLQFSR